jgi:hypothetical protein
MFADQGTRARLDKITRVGQARRGWMLGALFARKLDTLAVPPSKSASSPIETHLWGGYQTRPDAGWNDLRETQTWTDIQDFLPVNTVVQGDGYYQSFLNVMSAKDVWLWMDRVNESGPIPKTDIIDISINGAKTTESMQNLPSWQKAP